MPQGVALEAGAGESAQGVAAQLAAGAVLQGTLVHICGDRCSQKPATQLASHPQTLGHPAATTAPQGPQGRLPRYQELGPSRKMHQLPLGHDLDTAFAGPGVTSRQEQG